MANYLVDIAVKAVTDKASKDIDDVRKKIDKVKEAAERGFNLQGTNQLKDAWNQVGKNAATAGGKLGQALKTAENIGKRGALALGAGFGINVFTDLQRAIQNVQSTGSGLWNNLQNGARVAKASWDVLGPAVQNTADQIAKLPPAIGNAAESFASLPPTAQVALAAVIALFPQLSKVIGSTFGQVKQLAETNIPKLASAAKNGVNPITDNFQALDIQVRDTVESFIALETGAGSSLQKLNKAVIKARNEFESFNHEQIEAAEGAYKLAAALEAQNKERREMDNLLRRAQGKLSVEDEAQKKKDDRINEAVRQEKLRQAENRKERIKEISHQKLRLKIRRMDRREEKAREAARQRSRQKERLREGLMLGVGFPLLFGGGPLSILGGGAGALLQSQLGKGENKGKGFGAQIALSAVGGQIDRLVSTIVKGAMETSKAFTTVDGAMSLMEDRSLFSSQAIKEQAKALQKQGKNTELAALLTKEYTRILGYDGIRQMQELAAETEEAQKQWGTLRTQLELLLTGPLTDIMEWVNTFLTRQITKNALEDRIEYFISTGQKGKAGDLRKAIKEEQKRRSTIGSRANYLLKGPEMAGVTDVSNLPTTFIQELLGKSEFAGQSGSSASIPDVVSKPPKDKQTKLEKLREERDQLERIFKLGEKQAAIEQKILTMGEDQIDLTEEEYRKLLLQIDTLTELNQRYKEIGQTIKDGLVEGINAAIDGTKELGEIASSVFRRIQNTLLTAGVDRLLGGIPGLGKLFGNRAKGGPVTGGSPYIVGEKGPELFVPKKTGNIVPNHALSGGGDTNVVVNVDASGTSAQGNTGQAEQLGSMLAEAVQAELIKQQRPGGILANSR